MATADEVTIATTTEHTTEIARVSKEYAQVHDRWQAESDAATKLMQEAEHRQQQADTLKPQVDELKARLRELVK